MLEKIMPTLPLHFAPGILVMFMVSLAVVPLVLVWMDERRRARESLRLGALRREAGLQAMLARQSLVESGPRRGVRVPNG